MPRYSNISLSVTMSLLLTALCVCCKSPSYTSMYSEPNYAYLYNPTSTSLHPATQIFHTDDSVSELIVKLFPDELLFSKANEEGVLRSSISLNYKIWEIDDNGQQNPEVYDSDSLNYFLKEDDVNKRYYITTPFRAKQGKRYLMFCNIRDNYRNSGTTKFIDIDKTSKYNHQNFRVQYNLGNHLVFDPKSVVDEDLVIKYRDNSINEIFVKYYRDYQELPPPPNILVFEPNVYPHYDSMFVLPVNGSFIFRPEHEGLYLFQIDTSIERGLALMRFYDRYPRIEQEEEMIKPIEYLETTSKIREITISKNKKLSVDNYWLEKASENTERARHLVRIYYNRVFFANYYFTSHKEGWMTDRGMVFIIYGLPDIINKDSNSEKWIYLGKNVTKALTFNFDKKENAFGDNHYVLKRSDASKTFWQEAILSWKSGKVFSVNNL